MESELKEKLEKVVKLVDNVMVDSEIDIECCMPEVAMTSQACNTLEDPHIFIKYVGVSTLSQHVKSTQQVDIQNTKLE